MDQEITFGHFLPSENTPKLRGKIYIHSEWIEIIKANRKKKRS